jgi:sialate O-acetylesterase
MMRKITVIVFCFLMLHIQAQLFLPSIFSNDMVLQRDQPIVVWGKATPNEAIQIQFNGQIKTSVCSQDSSWKVVFKAMKASKVAHQLVVQSPREKIILDNIIIGDVWLCLGQSNMEWPMKQEKHFLQEIKQVDGLSIRFYNPSYAGKNIYSATFPDSVVAKLNYKDFYNGLWQQSDTTSIKNMSAVAYYFGKELHVPTNIPIGLINLSIGGAPIETFIDPIALKRHKTFKNKMNGDWLINPFLPEWIKERGRQNIDATDQVIQDVNGKYHGFKPGFAFLSGIKPLALLPIKGIIFYQGESNAQEMSRVLEYRELSKLMIKNYRELWKNKTLPFYFAQISSIDTLQYKGHLWPLFRDEQRKLMRELSQIGMAVTADHGMKNDVHPKNKKIVGERLARWVLHDVYHFTKTTFGPQPIKASYENHVLTIFFDQVLSTSDGEEVKGFSTNTTPHCNSVISGNRINIECSSKPDLVYYNWSPYTNGNLIGNEKLPASTFKLKVQ